MRKGYVRGWLGYDCTPKSVTLNPLNMPPPWKKVTKKSPCSNISAGHEDHGSPRDSETLTQHHCGQWDDDFSCPSRKPLVKAAWYEDSSLFLLQRKRLAVVSIRTAFLVHVSAIVLHTMGKRRNLSEE